MNNTSFENCSNGWDLPQDTPKGTTVRTDGNSHLWELHQGSRTYSPGKSTQFHYPVASGGVRSKETYDVSFPSSFTTRHMSDSLWILPQLLVLKGHLVPFHMVNVQKNLFIEKYFSSSAF